MIWGVTRDREKLLRGNGLGSTQKKTNGGGGWKTKLERSY